MASTVKCSSCGWSWNKSDSSKKDMYVCHKCGKDNSMKHGGWLDAYDDVPQAQKGLLTSESTALPKNLDPRMRAAVEEDSKRTKNIIAEKTRRENQGVIKNTKPFEVKDTRHWQSDSKAKERGDAAWNFMQKASAAAQYAPHPFVSYPAVALNSVMGLTDAYYANQEGDITNRNINLVGALPIPTYGVVKQLGKGLGKKFKDKATRAASMALGLDVYGTAADLTDNFGNSKKQQGGAVESYMGGLTDQGFNYNGAWGGTMQMGGNLPGAVGFTYARTKGIPSEGKYAKKTLPSAEEGMEILPDPEDPDRKYKLSAVVQSAKEILNPILRSKNPAVYDKWEADRVAALRKNAVKEYDEANPLSIYLSPEEVKAELTKQRKGYYEDYIGALKGMSEYDLGKESYVGQKESNQPIEGLNYGSRFATARVNLGKVQEGGEKFRYSYIPKTEEYRKENFQNGGEMSFYQHGLDFTPRNISRNGGEVPKAQWGLTRGDIASLPGVRKEIPLSKEQLAKNKKAVEERTKAENARILAERKQRLKGSEEAKKKPFSAKQLAEETQATADKFRLFPNDPNSLIDEYLNPGVVIGGMASDLGRIPYDLQQGNYGRAAMSVLNPLVTGALAGVGTKNAKQFANNLINPVAGIKDEIKNVYKKPFKKDQLEKTDFSKIDLGSPSPSSYTNYKNLLDEEETYKINIPPLPKFDFSNSYETIDPETGISKFITTLSDDNLNYSELPISESMMNSMNKNIPDYNYNKPLSSDEDYRKWADTIYPNLSKNVSIDELKSAHEKSLDYFKGATLTDGGGKEHGLFIRNLLSEKIPEFKNPIVKDDKGNQIVYGQSRTVSTSPEIKNVLEKSGYDVSKFTPKDWNIIDAYTKGYDNSINELLRSSYKPSIVPIRGAREFYKTQGDSLKETVLKNKAKEPFQVRRGVRDYSVNLLHPETYEPLGTTKFRSDLTKGDVFKDESFLSTSVNSDSSFGSANASEIIDIPGGGVQSIAIPEASSYPQFFGEKEVILPPGLIRRVEDVEDPNLPLKKGYRFRTSILNPYAVTGAMAAGAGAVQQKKQGGNIKKDDMGYWNPENWGEPVEIGSNEITMDGVYEPLMGVSDEGDVQMMYPGEDYKFKGKKVTEYPVKKNGGWLDKY